jgi:glycosyltransferase involved in cell wall biosynthesis
MPAWATVKSLSIILPTRDDAYRIKAALGSLQPLRERGAEVVVVDGGSSDATPVLCQGLADRVIGAPRGRARQLNTGAAEVRGEVLLFLDLDTRLPRGGPKAAVRAVEAGAAWGCFSLRAEGALAPVLAAWRMNLGARWFGIARFEQAIFVERDAFEAAGGWPDQPQNEDIAFSRRLREAGRKPVVLTLAVRRVPA